MPARAAVRNDMYQYHLLQSPHHLADLDQPTARLTLAGLDLDWLEPRLERGAIAIAHAVVDGEVVFTAATPQLQDFYRALPEDAFSDPLVFVRR